jgi:hypothetical protein
MSIPMKSKLVYALFAMVMLLSCTEKEPEEIDDLFFDNGPGSEKIDYSVFSTIPQANKKLIFSDGFTDNSGKWFEGKSTIFNSLYDFHIANGFYFMDYNVSGKVSGFTKDVGASLFSGDFEIEANLEILKTYSGTSGKFGMVWNDNNNSNNETYYFFEETYDSRLITVGAVNGNIRTNWKTADKSNSTILNNTQVKLTVRRVGDFYYFFVNENFICRHTYQNVSFGNTGVFLTQCSIKVDYFKVFTLTK